MSSHPSSSSTTTTLMLGFKNGSYFDTLFSSYPTLSIPSQSQTSIRKLSGSYPKAGTDFAPVKVLGDSSSGVLPAVETCTNGHSLVNLESKESSCIIMSRSTSLPAAILLMHLTSVLFLQSVSDWLYMYLYTYRDSILFEGKMWQRS